MFMVLVPDRKEFQEVYEQKVMKRLQHLQVPTGEVSLHATPIRSRREIGEYLELDDIGCGGFGDIFLLAHSQTGEVKAAKRFRDQKNHAAVLGEMATLSKLPHEHIVGYQGHLYDEGSLCLLMEYLPFGSVLEYELEQMAVLEILRQCLDALAYLHENGIMHRDIKPENIALQSLSPVNVKLIDFGLAREGCIANTLCGTPGYIPQEIVRGKGYTDLVDVWALGMTALDLLVGLLDEELRRFGKQRSIKNFDVYFHAVTQRRQTLPRPLSDLLAGMLEYDPAYRWSVRKCIYKLDAVDKALRDGLQGRSDERPPYNKPGRCHSDDQYAQCSPEWNPRLLVHGPRDEGRPHDRPGKCQPRDESDGCCDYHYKHRPHEKAGGYQPNNRPYKYQYEEDPTKSRYVYRPVGKAGNTDLANCFSKINLCEPPMARG
ncbi:hypothetical protein FQN54_002938 [Arachnomyces sp. PD_36]|nr:hypothetical protein FQN54_002938 [Arachnomyces sp. PD_36]